MILHQANRLRVRHLALPTRRSVSGVALAGLLALSSGGAFGSGAIAATQPSSVTDSTAPSVQGYFWLAQAQTQQTTRTRQSLPTLIANAIRQDLARRVNIPARKLRITDSKRILWNNACLGLPNVNEICRQGEPVPGWQVGVTDGQRTWTYHTDNMGGNLRLSPAQAIAKTEVKLPKPVADAVAQAAAPLLKVSANQVELLSFEQKTWPDGCLGLASNTEFCTTVLTPGWLVVVGANQQRLTYRTNETGSVVRLDTAASNLQPANLPTEITNAVLQAAAQQLNVNSTALRIVRFNRETWPDACLGLSTPQTFCAEVIVPGWLVTVESGNQRLVYRTNEAASLVKLDRGASNLAGPSGFQPERISGKEFIPPLSRGAVFRVVSSGGITGQTTAIVLRNDGNLSVGKLNPDGTLNVTRSAQVSTLQVQQFQKLLGQQNFAQFNRLNYPAPVGAADYISVTFTSRNGTTRYADLMQDQLPSELQTIIKAWEKIAERVQVEQPPQ
jgi:hypothetical protein